MTIPNLMAAVAQGFTAKQVVDWVSKNYKKYSKQVKSALIQGYNDEQILSYLTKGKYASHGQRNQMLEGMTEAEKASRIHYRPTDVKSLGKGVATAASLAAMAIPAIRGGQALARGARGLLGAAAAAGSGGGSQPPPGPQTLPSPSRGPQPMGGAPVQPAPLSPNAAARAASSQTLNAVTPEFQQYANQQIQQGQEKPLAVMLREFQENKESQGAQKSSMQAEQQMQAQPPAQTAIQPTQKPQMPEKGSVVSLPAGNVGVIKDIKKDHALVDEDGKIHKVKISDLQMPDEAVQQTVARLLEIPEIDKSSVINYWAYDPEDKDLFLMFHNGETYKYHDVPEELERELQESAVSPVTQGENAFGAWSPEDPKSRGATFIKKLIAHEKYKKPKKGQPENPNYRKLRKGYDYWAKLRKGS